MRWTVFWPRRRFRCRLRKVKTVIWRRTSEGFRHPNSRDPIGDKHVRLPLGLSVAMRNPYQLPAIRTKHREPIKPVVIGNSLQPRSVPVDRVQLEVSHSTGGAEVGRENNPLAVREKRGRKTRRV